MMNGTRGVVEALLRHSVQVRLLKGPFKLPRAHGSFKLVLKLGAPVMFIPNSTLVTHTKRPKWVHSIPIEPKFHLVRRSGVGAC